MPRGNPNGRPKYELRKVNNNQNVLVDPKTYILLKPQFAENCAALLHQGGLDRVKRIIEESPNDVAALNAVKFLTDRAYGGVVANINSNVNVNVSFSDTLQRVAEVIQSRVIDAEAVEITTEMQEEADDADFAG